MINQVGIHSLCLYTSLSLTAIGFLVGTSPPSMYQARDILLLNTRSPKDMLDRATIINTPYSRSFITPSQHYKYLFPGSAASGGIVNMVIHNLICGVLHADCISPIEQARVWRSWTCSTRFIRIDLCGVVVVEGLLAVVCTASQE